MKIELKDKNGDFKEIDGIENNHLRLVNVSVVENCCGGKLTPWSSHGSETIGIFSADILQK